MRALGARAADSRHELDKIGTPLTNLCIDEAADVAAAGARRRRRSR